MKTMTLLSALLFALLPATASALGTLPPAIERLVGENAGPCDADNGGIDLPDGFCAQVVADDLGTVRHIVARDNGDLYARLLRGGIVALRDGDGDGRFERQERFFGEGGTGIGIRGEYLYFATPTAIYRQRLAPDRLLPVGGIERVVSGFPRQGSHAAKSFALGTDGGLYVNIGAPSNACQEEGRAQGSPGLDPCPELERHAGIWRFDADRTGQRMTDGKRFATGLRNAVAIAWNRRDDRLYAVQHGRDQLHGLWPDLFTVAENAELPAEEFFRVDEGDDFGWPYCYYDQRQGKKLLAPEYGGDGDKVGRCDAFEKPITAFPGHWAPNGLLFHADQPFPELYRDGAFIAFHGSWNRAPLPQQGYKVVFLPFAKGEPSSEWQDFATGFAGRDTVRSTGEARYRPMGLARGPDGTLFIGDTREGRIWRVRYVGKEK